MKKKLFTIMAVGIFTLGLASVSQAATVNIGSFSFDDNAYADSSSGFGNTSATDHNLTTTTYSGGAFTGTINFDDNC